MTDLGASVGLEGLKDFKKILNYRKNIFDVYLNRLNKNKNIICVNKDDERELMLLGFLQLFLKRKILFRKN